jgi:DNA-directed RNA polymerase omega subunit
MASGLPLNQLILDASGSKYKLVVETAKRAKQIQQEKKEVGPEIKTTVLALRDVLEARYEKEEKEREKLAEKVPAKKKKK